MRRRGQGGFGALVAAAVLFSCAATWSQSSRHGGGKNIVRSAAMKPPGPLEKKAGQPRLAARWAEDVARDQAAFWTSPRRLRWPDGSWLAPAGVGAGILLATDVPLMRALPAPGPHPLVSLANYGTAAMAGGGVGLYVWGKLAHDEHQQETGVLTAEALCHGFLVDAALKGAFGRARPDQGRGGGGFLRGGNSFPSQHAMAVWSAASVIAHEYPGPWTKILAYGMAATVSAARVGARQHFPADVAVGGGLGWLMGREIYRRHHDPGLGGAGWAPLSGEERQARDHRRMASPFVELDSWVYPALERLAALGYIRTAIAGLKPWTRIECARLTEEAGAALEASEDSGVEAAAALLSRLQDEFSYEFTLLDGQENVQAGVESLYTRALSISGPALTDSYHFGQTVAYDYGRPFSRGMNGQAGGSVSASAGAVTVYVRAEYQHAPAAVPPSAAVIRAIAAADGVSISQVPAAATSALDRPQLLDAYLGVNLGSWEMVAGRQSLDWAPGPGGSLLWSDNIPPVDMLRLVNPEPLRLPGILRWVGPVRIDQFFGRLAGHVYIPDPFVYGQKINLKPFPWLEIGLGRTVILGGRGGEALTLSNFLHSFVGSKQPALDSVPGDSRSSMDWTLVLPGLRHWIELYGEGEADDDILPIENPRRNPWRPGIFLPRIPGIPRLDLHLEAVSTEQPGAFGGGNFGRYNYWNYVYRDGYTNQGYLVGNAVGRDGRSVQAWITYWRSPRNTWQFTYRRNRVGPDFHPGGGAWQDYTLSSQTYWRSGMYFKSQLQYEPISRYPALFPGRQRNLTAMFELGISPHWALRPRWQ